jgi:hypothetical protein
VLQGHVRALKDYCLLAKGDFFHLFFEDSRAIMALPPRPSSELDLNVPFQQAAIRSTAVRRRYMYRTALSSLTHTHTRPPGCRNGGIGGRISPGLNVPDCGWSVL